MMFGKQNNPRTRRLRTQERDSDVIVIKIPHKQGDGGVPDRVVVGGSGLGSRNSGLWGQKDYVKR